MLGVFWLTTDCNMKCIYCYEGTEKSKLYMSDKIANDSIEFLIKHLRGIYQIRYSHIFGNMVKYMQKCYYIRNMDI